MDDFVLLYATDMNMIDAGVEVGERGALSLDSLEALHRGSVTHLHLRGGCRWWAWLCRRIEIEHHRDEVHDG